MTDTTSDLDADLRREHEEVETALHNLIVKRLHAGDCGCKSEVHPPDQWDYYSRLADSVTDLFLPQLEWGTRTSTAPDAPVCDADDLEHARLMRDKMGWGPVVSRLSAVLVGQPWTEVER